MVNKIFKKTLFLLSVLFFISFISASATIGNISNSISNSYGPGDMITGGVNVSISNEPSTSIISSSLGGEISLFELLKKTTNSGFVYTCNPTSCTSYYTTQSQEPSKSLTLGAESSALIAFRLTGNVGDISRVSFNVTSNNAESQKFPLSIDVLNDGENEWNSYFRTDNFGPQNFGCLSTLDLTEDSYLNTNPYCQRIVLTKAPRVRIGAEVDSAANIDYTMSIESTDGTASMQSCTASTSTDGVQIISCIPNFPINERGSYFVCINTKKSSDANKYTLPYESSENPCGFAYPFSGAYSYNFKIFAEQANYAPNINFTFDNDELEESGSPITDIESYIQEYVSNTYNNNCTAGCIIPIKIKSGVSQTVSITNPIIIYQSNGLTISSTTIYDAEETPARISSPFGLLNLDEAGFSVSETSSTYNLEILFNNNVLLEKEIKVGKIPSVNYIFPLIAPANYPVIFRAGTTMPENITKYTWNFGDGTIITNNMPQMNHTYSVIGNYILKVTTLDASGRNYTKSFNLIVESAEQAIPSLLAEAELKMSLIQQKNALLSPAEKISLKRLVNIDAINSNLTRLRNLAQSATTETQYNEILQGLIALKIPDDIGATLNANGMFYYPKADYADLDAISGIYSESYDITKQQLYKEAVIEWELQNTEVKFDYSELSSIYSDYTEESVKTFDIIISYSGSEEAYAIIRDVEGMIFTAGSPEENNGYYSIPLTSEQTKITFSATGEVDFTSLPMVITPALSKLTLESNLTPEKTINKWARFLIIAISIVIVAGIIWVLLKIWYKKRYENYLFKNKNNLYNLINYIKTSKEKGISEKDIILQLKKSGWNSEQITYAIKKYEGKETGMPEIQIGFRLKKNTDGNTLGKNPQKKG